jgi:hypothetical protein
MPGSLQCGQSRALARMSRSARCSLAHHRDRAPSVRLSDLKAPPARMPAERWSVAQQMSPQDAGGRRAIPRPEGPR